MTTNTTLVRYRDGWVEVADATGVAADGRREGFLSVAAIPDADGGVAAGRAALSTVASAARSTVVEIDPGDEGHTPYLGWWPGDSVQVPDESGVLAVQRVESVTVGEDADGWATFTPELVSPLTVRAQRTQRWLEAAGRGALDGAAAQATLADGISGNVERGKLDTREKFFSSGSIDIDPSPGLPLSETVRITKVTAVLRTPGSTPTIFQVARNGVPLTWWVGGVETTNIQIPAGWDRRFAFAPSAGDNGASISDAVNVIPIQAGTGAEDLTVSLLLADKW